MNCCKMNIEHRGVLLEWVIEVCVNFELRPETIALTLSIIDRYIVIKTVKTNEIQLVGCGAIFIACKYEELLFCEVNDLVYVTKKVYNKDDIYRMEADILNTLGFRLSVPTVLTVILDHLNKLSKLKVVTNEVKVDVVYFLLLSHLESKCCEFDMSTIAESVIYLAGKRQKQSWIQKPVDMSCSHAIFEYYSNLKNGNNRSCLFTNGKLGYRTDQLDKIATAL